MTNLVISNTFVLAVINSASASCSNDELLLGPCSENIDRVSPNELATRQGCERARYLREMIHG